MATQVFAVSAFEEKGERASQMTFTDGHEREGENGLDLARRIKRLIQYTYALAVRWLMCFTWETF